MGKLARLAVVICLSVSIVPLSIGSAFACSCAEVGDRRALEEADVVFTGYVTRGEYPGEVENVDDTLGEIRWSFMIDTIVKNATPGEIDVSSHSQGGACGVAFQVGGRYLVFANEQANGTLSTSSCSRTRSFYDEVKLTGAEKVEGIYGPQKDDALPLVPIGLGAGLIIVLIATGWFVRKRTT